MTWRLVFPGLHAVAALGSRSSRKTSFSGLLCDSSNKHFCWNMLGWAKICWPLFEPASEYGDKARIIEVPDVTLRTYVMLGRVWQKLV